MNVDVRHLKFLTFSEAEVFELEAQPGSKITKYSLQDVHLLDAFFTVFLDNLDMVIFFQQRGCFYTYSGSSDNYYIFQLADKLKSTLVINGDGRDLTLLREEGIKNVDAFISLTGSYTYSGSSDNYYIFDFKLFFTT